ncbi:hypothetical protein CFP56_030622 [Quercus suber]|uniref:Protein N-terminal asparagine amidohydrolase n=1 Tax=Quercus suber TaxID=58331 RepID=A0AAW0LUQ6_QUESU
MKIFAYEQGSNTLVALMEDPILVSASNSFKAILERKFSVYEESGMEGLCKWTKNNWFVGIDEATTCVCLVIHHKQNRMTSVAHMDSPNIVDMGLSQVSYRVIGHNLDAELDNLSVLGHNTRRDSKWNAYPIFNELQDVRMRLLGEFESPHPMRTPVGVAGCLRHMILKLINSELLHAAGTIVKLPTKYNFYYLHSKKAQGSLLSKIVKLEYSY